MFSQIKAIIGMAFLSVFLVTIVAVYAEESYCEDLVNIKVEHLLVSEQSVLSEYEISNENKEEIIDESSLNIGSSENNEKVIDNVDKLNTYVAENLSMTTVIEEVSVNNRLSTRIVSDGDYIWPVTGYYDISSPYGWRSCPFHGPEYHTGTDIPAPAGTPIRAVKQGIVVESEYKGSYGNCVVMRHPDNTTSLYAHMLEQGVSVGTEVVQGEQIGKVGSTGNSTGNHLHLEIWLGPTNDSRVDPMSLIKK